VIEVLSVVNVDQARRHRSLVRLQAHASLLVQELLSKERQAQREAHVDHET